MLGNVFNIAKVIVLVFLCTMISCKPSEDEFSPLPVISLEEVSLLKDGLGKDSIIVLTIYYEDGDGDIGLTDADTAAPFNFGSPFYHNFPVTYLAQNSMGEYEEVINPNTNKPYGNQHERVPNLTPEGKYKAIRGTIKIDLIANPVQINADRVILRANLIDRALNVSNTVETAPIELEH